MKVLVKHKKDETLDIIYTNVAGIERLHYQDTGKQWRLVFPSKDITEFEHPTATFSAEEYEVYRKEEF